MAAGTAEGPAPHQPGSHQGSTLFGYDVAREGRLVTRVVGIGERGLIRVVAEVYPVLAPETTEPQWRFYDFPTREQANAFVDEALLALEYLGCTVTEARAHPARAEPGAASSAAAAA